MQLMEKKGKCKWFLISLLIKSINNKSHNKIKNKYKKTLLKKIWILEFWINDTLLNNFKMKKLNKICLQIL